MLESELAAKIGRLEAAGKLQVESKDSSGSGIQLCKSDLDPCGCRHFRRTRAIRYCSICLSRNATSISHYRQQRFDPAFVHV
jgi:hypothetical protein